MNLINVNLYKYRKQLGEVINYFTEEYPTFVDSMTLTNIPIDGLPNFNEEYTKEDDINVIKSGDYNLKFSLLQDEISVYGHIGIKDFLLPAADRNFKLLCSFEWDGIERWGTVDITSIKANYTVTQNRYDISFKVYGLLKELSDGLKTIDLFQGEPPDNTNNIPFSDYLSWHFRSVPWLKIENKLDLDAVCHFPVKVSEHMRLSLYLNGLNQGYSVWEGLKSFAIGLGFVMRLEYAYGLQDPQYPRFKLVLFWRSQGSGNAVKPVDVIEDEESNSLLFDNQYLIMKYTRIENVSPIPDSYMGLFMSKNLVFVGDLSDEDIYFKIPIGIPGSPSLHPNQLWIDSPESQTYYDLSYISELSIPQHREAVLQYPQRYTDVAYCRILTLSGYNQHGFSAIIYATEVNEYKYLLNGVKEKRDLKVSLLDNNYRIFDIISYQNKTYWISRISDVNIYEKTAKLELIRIN